MIDRKLIKNIDSGLIMIVLILFMISLVIISSATHVMQEGLTRQVKVQTVAFCLGIIAVAIIFFFDYNTFGEFYTWIYGLSILMLLLVYVPGVGKIQAGARSWINLGPVDFQPSELVKILFVLSFAKFLENKQQNINTFKGLISVAAFAAPPLVLILKEPDLGTAMVLSIIIIGMLFVAELDYKIIGMGLLAGIISMPLAYKFMAPHQRIRIDAFLNPSDPTLPGNYHVIQSKIAIGSGQLFGKGLYQGTQNNFNFLPVQETDFIYAVLGEEFGFVGGAFVLIMYFMFLYRMIRIAKMAKDTYGALIVTGITSMFAFQIFENIGMTMGVMPVTGVTLSFLSYGGSSIVTNMIALGIVLNVGMRRMKIKF
ncbi:rod shape determining protein RodA [Geosporobacter subterraneus DSM 17957]|uniref:Peptidoglycan glycosyltransferase RodA n=1 Tax=Geosporobacter subterraneus DSM 17957 TaxID=1121919 RepID=A0A1M6N225_9FIRM|nr:rod shape-determining protein RodA [Geosporobacter subterraneus]SHJ89741.1 rod shape determining protein RodA [Geosporobacter subterraneus DSM 17957]